MDIKYKNKSLSCQLIMIIIDHLIFDVQKVKFSIHLFGLVSKVRVRSNGQLLISFEAIQWYLETSKLVIIDACKHI